MGEKEKVLKLLKYSDNIPLDVIWRLLADQDKDIKHEAWNYVIKHISEFNKGFLLNLLAFPDAGTRYRVWNAVPQLIEKGILTVEDVKQFKSYMLEMLEDKNKVVRALSWYITLKPLLDVIIDIDEVKVYLQYLCELIHSEYYDIVEEVLDELNLSCDDSTAVKS